MDAPRTIAWPYRVGRPLPAPTGLVSIRPLRLRLLAAPCAVPHRLWRGFVGARSPRLRRDDGVSRADTPFDTLRANVAGGQDLALGADAPSYPWGTTPVGLLRVGWSICSSMHTCAHEWTHWAIASALRALQGQVVRAVKPVGARHAMPGMLAYTSISS